MAILDFFTTSRTLAGPPTPNRRQIRMIRQAKWPSQSVRNGAPRLNRSDPIRTGAVEYGVPNTHPDDDAAILRRFGLEPDPVIEVYKRDVDRTLLRENLRRTPEERWHNFLAAYRLADEIRRAGAAARGR